jgi:hypothetical protein
MLSMMKRNPMAKNDRNRTLEDITIAFRNFAGKEDMYNRQGDRNFAIILPPDVADSMLRDGWNVKYLKARDEGDEPQPYIQVAVSYKNRPPKICLVTSKSMTYLTEAEVEMLDWVDIETADCTLNPYDWSVNGKAGTKAYLQSLYIKIEEDYLQAKWSTYVEESKKEQLQVEGSSLTVIDGEYEVH